ncbi:MAG: hypothetical protein HXS44_06370 [Theionarchaea archaeon]|nr:hypothetical protein [Theionarchaea archaeon]
MTKSAGIFYFSGTGNTRIVAHLFGKELENSGFKVETCEVENILKGKNVDVTKYNIIGMGYPVHALNAPKIFFEFIKKLPSEDKKVFLFKTSGDPFMHGGPTTMVKNQLTKKGYHVFYEGLIVMPSNVLIRYNDNFVKQLYDAAVSKVEKMVQEILEGKKILQQDDILQIFAYLFSGLEWLGAPFFGKDLKVLPRCNSCSKCVRNCPKNNISEADGKIQFGWKCIMCMRCIHNCPVKAIEPRLYKFLVLKEYTIQGIIRDPTIKGDFITRDTKGYFKRFYTYLKE